MAKEATCYFKHDANALYDPKIRDMRVVYGMQGFGLYWAIVGDMRTQPGYKLPISGKYAMQGYADTYHVEVKTLQTFIDDCVNEFKLFETDGNYLWSESLIRRMETYDTICQQNSQASAKRWEEEKRKRQQQNTPAKPLSKGNSGTPNVQAEERTEKITFVTKASYGEFKNVHLSDNEYQKLISKFGEPEAKDKIEELSQALKSRKGYAQKYTDHYSTILSWDRKDKKKAQPVNVRHTDIKVCK